MVVCVTLNGFVCVKETLYLQFAHFDLNRGTRYPCSLFPIYIHFV